SLRELITTYNEKMVLLKQVLKEPKPKASTACQTAAKNFTKDLKLNGYIEAKIKTEQLNAIVDELANKSRSDFNNTWARIQNHYNQAIQAIDNEINTIPAAVAVALPAQDIKPARNELVSELNTHTAKSNTTHVEVITFNSKKILN